MRLALFFCLVIFGFQALAHTPVDGHIYATSGAMLYQTAEFDHQFDSPFRVAPSLMVEGDLNRHGGFEIQMFYLRNPFSIERDGKVFTQYVKRMYIAMGYRHWFTPWVSTGLAFSSSYAMGDPKILRDDFNDSRDRPGTSASDITEYGFVLSVQNELYRKGRFSMVVDGRLDYSVTAKRGEDSNMYGIFLGLKYFVQAREKIDETE